MVKRILIGTFCIISSLQIAGAQDQTTVSFDSGAQTVFDQGTNPLTGGTSADGNGAVLQLGYFSSASDNNNFTGTWIPLSGQTSLNTAYNNTSIGDRNSAGAGDGTFALSLVFVVGDPNTGFSFPAAGTPLSLRFYNGTSIATSTFYNTVSNNIWDWKAPQPSNIPNTVAISLDQTAGLLWESIVVNGQSGASAFHTTIAVPEPSTVSLICFGLAAAPFAYLRRRRRP